MRIEALTHTGMGRATDGTLVPRVLPGEDITLAEDGTVRIDTPSVNRVAAPCRHYKTCGGCAVQHAADDFVAKWKMDIVRKALTAQGLPADLAGIETSPAQSRRRASWSGRRTKKGAQIGFHARGSDLLVPTPECQLLTPALMAALPAAEALVRRVCSRTGEARITVTQSLAGPDVRVDYDAPLTGDLRIDLAQLAQEHDLARLSYGDEPIATIDPPAQQFGTARVVPPPGAFLQATDHGQEVLTRAVVQATTGARRIVDLFSGCGTFSLPLAAQAEVHAVEGETEMVEALSAGWRKAQGLKSVSVEARDLFRRPLLPDELSRFDAAVIDPPRAGADAQIAEIAEAKVPVVAMVSCNPVTFARDAQRLVQAGYVMQPPLVVDQFRWSAHVELVATFTMA